MIAGLAITGLALTATALVGVIALEPPADPGGQTTPAARPTLSGSITAAPAEHPDDPGPARIATILARPVFEPSRRPAAAPAAIATVADLPRLTGVISTQAGHSAIFAATTAGGKPLIAVEGTRIGAYVVQSIGAGWVMIMGPDGARTLRPSFDPNRVVPPARAPS